MRIIKIICAFVGFVGLFAAIVGAGALDKNLTLGAAVMIGGVLSMGVALAIAALTGVEDE